MSSFLLFYKNFVAGPHRWIQITWCFLTWINVANTRVEIFTNKPLRRYKKTYIKDLIVHIYENHEYNQIESIKIKGMLIYARLHSANILFVIYLCNMTGNLISQTNGSLVKQ
jgi:hypothetical protein